MKTFVLNNDCGEIHLNVAINSPDDDIEENANGAMDFNGQILSLSQNSVPGAEKKIGLRFSSLNVPQGATITSASITVTAQSDDGSPGLDAITIRAEQAKNSAPYETNNSNASSRPHGSLTTWMPGPWVAGQQFKTSDLTTQVQEIVNRGDWCGGNAISFLMTGAASRDIVSYNNGTQADSVASGEAPILNVSYDTSSIQSGGGCATKFLASQVISSSDDAEEFSFAYPARTSTDLDLFSEFRYQNQGRYPYQVGIRFRDINIPKNSVIVDARIEFTMRANSIGSGHSARNLRRME